MAITSLMSRPPSLCRSTAGWNPLPWQPSHGAATPAAVTRSMWINPLPAQAGQAPSELALKSAGFTLFALANALRIGSRTPV